MIFYRFLYVYQRVYSSNVKPYEPYSYPHCSCYILHGIWETGEAQSSSDLSPEGRLSDINKHTITLHASSKHFKTTGIQRSISWIKITFPVHLKTPPLYGPKYPPASTMVSGGRRQGRPVDVAHGLEMEEHEDTFVSFNHQKYLSKSIAGLQ